MVERRTFAVLSTVLLVGSLAVGSAAASPSGELPNSLSSDHFLVKYPDGYESSAESTLKHLQDIRPALQSASPVNTTVDGKIEVRLHPIEEWTDSRYSLHWHTYDPYQIDLIAPEDWRSVEGIDTYYIKKNLGHEYANIMLYNYAERHGTKYHTNYPAWFGEGLSEYYAYHNISSAILENKDPGTGELKKTVREGSGYFEVMAQNRYAGGHLLMHYMVDKYGEEKLFEILRVHNPNFEAKVESTLEVSYDVFKKKWLVWAETNIGGEYKTSEEGISKAQQIDTLEDRVRQKNETIEDLRDRIAKMNETIEELRGNASSDGTAPETTSSPEQEPTGDEYEGAPGDTGLGSSGNLLAAVVGSLTTIVLGAGYLVFRDRW